MAERDAGRGDGEEAVDHRRPDGLGQLHHRAAPLRTGRGQRAVVAQHLDGLPEAEPDQAGGQELPAQKPIKLPKRKIGSYTPSNYPFRIIPERF